MNIRTPGVLGRFLNEMRAGSISETMWELYLSRVAVADDVRFQRPPFSTGHPQFIVHRHRIRVRQSFQNAVDYCRAN